MKALDSFYLFVLHFCVNLHLSLAKKKKKGAQTASNGRFMDLSETRIQKQIWNQWLRLIPHRPKDRGKLTYQVLIKYFEKFSFWFVLGASLNTSKWKCGGCLLSSSHGNMDYAFSSSFWDKFGINCFLSKIYLKSIHPTPDIWSVPPATFIILLNRTGFSLAHKLWKRQK